MRDLTLQASRHVWSVYVTKRQSIQRFALRIDQRFNLVVAQTSWEIYMRQLLYVSSAKRFVSDESIRTILNVSRPNNRRHGLSGLLWSDGARFLQVLEGHSTDVDHVLAKIRSDPRHHAIVILHDKEIATRTFGDWTMASLNEGDDAIQRALLTADPTVRGTFEGLVHARRAA